MPTPRTFGGLRVSNFDDIDNRFLCVLCKMVLLSPWQLLCCGTLLCAWCMKRGISNSEPFVCPFCQTKQDKKEALADRGAERELKTIVTQCYSCPWKGLYREYSDHLQEEHADLTCNDCHERFFAINSYEEHRQDLCIHRSLPCGLPNCTDSIKWSDMLAHYLSEKHQYTLHLIIAQYVHPQRQQIHLNNRAEIIKKESNEIDEVITIIFTTVNILIVDQTRLKAENELLKTTLEQNLPKIDQLKRQDNANDKRVKELLESQNNLQTDLNSIKQATIGSQCLMLDENCTTTLRFTYPNTPSFSIHSSKFKTSEYGYTFALRLCSTIESSQEYLSLFLTLYRGEYDNLIPYPFPYDIHVALWDQSNQQNHIEHVVKPNLTSSAFARPTSEKNEDFAILKFCSLEHLKNTGSIHVKDDVCFIRIFVDFFNTGQNPFRMKCSPDDIGKVSTSTMITN